MGTAVGAAGVALTADLWLPLLAQAQALGGAAPKPIPGGIQPFGTGTEVFHLNLPAAGFNPSTITDFNGVIAFAEVQGTGTGTDATGTATPLLFDVDMRFMDGAYLGVDGKVYTGLFGFFWLDLYKGQFDFTNFTTQVRDFDPGFVKDGLFWTVPIPRSSVSYNLSAPSASMKVTNFSLLDLKTVPNALMHGPSIPAAISADVEWSGSKGTEQAGGAGQGFTGKFILTDATIAFTATEAGFSYVSDPASTSKTFMAKIGTALVGTAPIPLSATPRKRRRHHGMGGPTP